MVDQVIVDSKSYEQDLSAIILLIIIVIEMILFYHYFLLIFVLLHLMYYYPLLMSLQLDSSHFQEQEHQQMYLN